ncbi:hypothetical protein SAMN05660236_5667 [Ohtaekwangia koreensis]|uniref:Uncharacterized protein n=1 Tax=Ohtaekwangia koreensis TaxID=688867 RepID=A0A1T5ML48_9BACT|nr:hypothetical protein SAMN05660236_5667 [Ohtaekwangia koreensis]
MNDILLQRYQPGDDLDFPSDFLIFKKKPDISVRLQLQPDALKEKGIFNDRLKLRTPEQSLLS